MINFGGGYTPFVLSLEIEHRCQTERSLYDHLLIPVTSTLIKLRFVPERFNDTLLSSGASESREKIPWPFQSPVGLTQGTTATNSMAGKAPGRPIFKGHIKNTIIAWYLPGHLWHAPQKQHARIFCLPREVAPTKPWCDEWCKEKNDTHFGTFPLQHPVASHKITLPNKLQGSIKERNIKKHLNRA